MSPEENKILLKRLFEEGINQDRSSVIDELIAPDFVNYGLPSQARGVEGFRQLVGMFRAGFPDLSVSVEEVIAEGDKVVSRGVMTGTHRGDFMGVPASGKCVTVDYLDIWRIENGKFVENRVQMDMIGLMQQLGLGAGAAGGREEAFAGRGASTKAQPNGGYRMSADENKALVRETLHEMWNRGNLDVIDKAYAPGYRAHDPGLPYPVRSPSDLKQVVGMFRSVFPDIHMTVEDQIASSDRVVTRWVARGTHKGSLMGREPTGKDITVVGLSISRIENGRIAEEWTNWDTLGMMRQMGTAPPSEGKGM